MKPDGQNSVISSVISKWLLPELSFSDRWSRGTKTLGTRLLLVSKYEHIQEKTDRLITEAGKIGLCLNVPTSVTNEYSKGGQG